MPRVTLNQTNFTAGELSPRAQARTDIARYQNGAKRLENVTPSVQGGVPRRDGLRFVQPAKFADRPARLIRFPVNKQDAHVLEFGNLYARVHSDGVYSGVELVSPYDTSDTQELDYAHAASTMFIFHSIRPIHWLRRYSDARWSIEQAPFVRTPIDEIGWRPAVTLTIPSGTTGTQTATVPTATFLASDLGRTITADGGAAVCTITNVGSPTSVTVNITRWFAAGSYVADAWKIEGSPQTPCTPSAVGPQGATINLVLGGAGAPAAPLSVSGASYDVGAGFGAVILTFAAPHGWTGSLSAVVGGFTPTTFNGTFTITVTNATTVFYTLGVDPGAAVTLGSVAEITIAAAAGWRAADIDAYVRINGGLAQITEISSPTTAKATVLNVLTGAIVSPVGSWSLERPVWNSIDGFPRCGVIHEQRLWVGGTNAYPTTVWGSKTGRYLDFQDGPNDDDSVAYELQTDGEPILYMANMSALVVFTSGNEITLHGGIEKPLAPSNVSARIRSNHGCALVKPERVRRELMFVQSAGKKLRAIAYSTAVDDFNSPDMTILADTMLGSGGVGLAYQQEPLPLVWVRRADSTFASMTIDRDQEVVAWARHSTDGVIESMTTIPRNGRDEVWCVVRRNVLGVDRRNIEVMDGSARMDAEVSLSGSVVSVPHLAGKTVGIVADGVYVGTGAVANDGQLTLPVSAAVAKVGLLFTPLVQMLTPEFQVMGSAQGNSVRVGEVTIKFHETAGCTINGDQIAFRQFGSAVLDQPVPVVTGKERHELLGWARGESELTIAQPDPLPFEVLSVARKTTVND